ncbi:type II toxin-antitoxin system VapC family toxin [Candidatus Woesearchaeota archaeon]|nr:type II toxin-antitoxin system VapC family toxin [Candidatus Woesearchaeota archaeon]
MAVYLDTNIFIYAFTDEVLYGKGCRELLDAVKSGKSSAVTSALTFHEGFSVIRRLVGFEGAVTFAENLLSMPNLQIIPVDGARLLHSLHMIKKYRILAGDAIHAASSISANCEFFYSYDKELKKLEEIKIRTPRTP